MREKVRDKERLMHILSAINVLISNKDKHSLDEIIDDPIVFYAAFICIILFRLWFF